MITSVRIHAFVDFDGTITKQDVGDAMFERFGGTRSVEAVNDYRDEKISAAECFRRESEACGIVDVKTLDKFLDGQEVDETFIDFVRFCRESSINVCVLSDGMDYYIRRILSRHGASDVSFYSNKLEFRPVNGDASKVQFAPVFPYQDETCTRCASCKRNHMLSQTADEDIIIYVGEGYSDRCPVRFADMVFAKDDLLKYCQAENITYYEYQSFADIVRRLERMVSGEHSSGKQLLRKRRQAQLARQSVYLGG